MTRTKKQSTEAAVREIRRRTRGRSTGSCFRNYWVSPRGRDSDPVGSDASLPGGLVRTGTLGLSNRAGGVRYRKRGFLRAGYRSGRRPRRAGNAAEVLEKETEVPKVTQSAGDADRLYMLTQWGRGAEVRYEETEVTKTYRAGQVIVRVANVSTVV